MARIGIYGERGAALITSLIILTLLTLIGLAATNTSILETMISSSERTHAEAFYAAEAGVDHLRRNFKSLFVEKNAARIAAGVDPDWDFVLNGSLDGVDAATDITFEDGARWITGGDLSSVYLYNVTVWNNDDGGSATDDTDSVIMMRADAQVPNGGIASIEISLFGGATGGSVLTGYGAQEGAGAGKNYNSNDTGAITNFSTQIN
ncbi:MAG: hypothetical protein K8R55_01840 [Desulfuromonadaceae bacterium]|nr:hypothetical protein [Desulfuromonadaceae bacterium]